MTLETLLDQIAAAGYHVEMLHQNYLGTWAGSLRRVDDPCAKYPCSGATAYAALSSAFAAIQSGEGRWVKSNVVLYTGPELENKPAATDLSGIISKLRAKNQPAIKRRV